MILPITVYTSLSFSVVSYIAFVKHIYFLGTLWHLLCGMSTINHMNHYLEYRGKATIKRADTILAHVVVLASMYFALTANINYYAIWVFWLCLAYMATIFYVTNFSHLPNGQWEPWHASIHIAAIIGEMALFIGYTP